MIDLHNIWKMLWILPLYIGGLLHFATVLFLMRIVNIISMTQVEYLDLEYH